MAYSGAVGKFEWAGFKVSVNVSIGLWIQPVDATHWLNRRAAVIYANFRPKRHLAIDHVVSNQLINGNITATL